MQVQCPSCGAGGNLPDNKIPHQGTKITCPKCKTAFVVKKPQAQSGASETDNHYQDGVKLLKQRQVDAAIEQFYLALRQNAEHADAYRYLGLAYGQKNLWAEAIQVLQEAVSFRADDVQSLKNLGVAYLKQERASEAVQVLQQAIQHAPNDSKAQAYYEMAAKKLAGEQKQENVSEDDFEGFQDFAPSDDGPSAEHASADEQPASPKDVSQPDPVNLLLDKGVECLDNAKYNGAIEAFNEVIRLAPSSANGYFGLGMVYEKRGDWSQAIDAYERALDLNPDDSAARESLKFAKKQKKKFQWKFWKK